MGNDPSAHLGLLARRTGGAASLEQGSSPVRLDMSADGEAEMAVVARTASDRWLVLYGCQDGAVAVLGAFRMPGLSGTVSIEPFQATRAPVHEIKATLTAQQGSSLQEFWAFFAFDGADLAQIYGWFVRRVPQAGNASRAAVTFQDQDGDGQNEILVSEETLDGEGARARVESASAPLPRILAVRTLRFRFDPTRRMFAPVP